MVQAFTLLVKLLLRTIKKFFFHFTDKQKWIGYSDVKSAPAHFYVQRNSSFHSENTPITFHHTRVNGGNAMNLTSGKFTALRPGIYFFSFIGHARFPDRSSDPGSFRIYLVLNGNQIGTSRVVEGNTVSGQLSPVTVQSTLDLKKNDSVWVSISHCCSTSDFYLFDDTEYRTHFTGFMLEEEIAASL